MQPLPIGISDFKEMREHGYYYSDKSLFIQELLKSRAKVALIPRPRRFGKTLNLSMLKYFFERTEQTHGTLFEGLAIASDSKSMVHQGQYPVIFLTFKDTKGQTWKKTYYAIVSLIVVEYKRHVYLLEGTVLDKMEKQDFLAIIERTADESVYEESIKNLSSYLARYHKKNPIILIDEYDTPIHAGFTHDYYTDVINFMRSLLASCLKDNNNLEFAVMTGILRVTKESIFSGLNNLKVCSLIDDIYSDKFGLTQPDADQLLRTYNLEQHRDAVRLWYNGYTSGPITVYNPWSLINFVDNKGRFQPYWVNTSSNDLVKSSLLAGDSSVKERLEQLIRGEPISEKINENIIFSDIAKNDTVLWNFLLFSGYLTFNNLRLVEDTTYADLMIPNAEIRSIFKTIVLSWFEEQQNSRQYQAVLDSLVQGDVEKFKDCFENFVATSISYFDINQSEPERVYHALVLGMLVSLLSTHEVKSNRESGYGRYDVMIIPKDVYKPSIIIEFKKTNKRIQETIKEAAQRALEQIEQRQYAQELRARGITNIIKLGIAFEGKHVLVAEG